MKWHPQMIYGWDHSKGEMPNWNDEETPTEDYLEAVELYRELREIPYKLRKDFN